VEQGYIRATKAEEFITDLNLWIYADESGMRGTNVAVDLFIPWTQ